MACFSCGAPWCTPRGVLDEPVCNKCRQMWLLLLGLNPNPDYVNAGYRLRALRVVEAGS